MIIAVPLLSALVGLLLIGFAEGKLAGIGQVLFWTGWLVFLLQLARPWISLLGGR